MAVVSLARPIACLPWHLRGTFKPEYLAGRVCRFCERAIAAPENGPVCCIYCALDRKIVPEQEIEP